MPKKIIDEKFKMSELTEKREDVKSLDRAFEFSIFLSSNNIYFHRNSLQ